MKYYAAAITVLTYLRGQATSDAYASAKQIIHQQQVDEASPVKKYVLQASPPPIKEPP